MAIVSISTCRELGYENVGESTHASAFPEYPFDTIGISGVGDVYALVRRCLYEAGCDRENFGTARWNPLGTWIKPGDRVFVLPNFVMHRRPDESTQAFQSKCTHASVVRAVLDYATIATGDARLVSFGNAPLQACDYSRILVETGADAVTAVYQAVGNDQIGPHDLRLLVTRWTAYGALLARELRHPSEGVFVDLGPASWLEEHFSHSQHLPLFRVGDYPPEETMSYHSAGRHVYVVHKRVLEADVIISIPKLKTHQKVGITCALKGTVGSIARKECLAHHRRGGPEQGGDEYPKSSFLRTVASLLNDYTANGQTDLFSNAMRVTSKILSRLLRLGPQGIMGGAWYGNDTAWRMTLDIARILRYARRDGTLSEQPLRHHLALVDGIIAGEGEGPLRPSPRNIGAVLFSSDICSVDAASALVMGYDPSKLPLIRHSFDPVPFALTEQQLSELTLLLDGQTVSALDILERFRPAFVPPKGWQGWIEADPVRVNKGQTVDDYERR